MILTEGGNIFKNVEGQALTQRINRQDISSTVQWLEAVTGVDFTDKVDSNNIPIKWLGSTGRKTSSGDLDLAVDSTEISKEQLREILVQWAKSQGVDDQNILNTSKNKTGWIQLAGDSVHFRAPINGDPQQGFVQTDFIFLPNLKWGIFYYSSDPSSEYKGLYRNILLSSLAKYRHLTAGNKGVIDRASSQPVTFDPDQTAKLLLNAKANQQDLRSVESIYNALRTDPNRDAKLRDFREYLAREGLTEPGIIQENDVHFLARLRDRIVNQGMRPLIENDLIYPYAIYEAEESGVGGRAKGIEHLEDYVFRQGTAGIQKALNIVRDAAAQPRETVTVKWDGKPAVIFGRKPSTGEFVLTDGSGFEAKGYDGLATSPKMMAQIQNARGGGRENLIAIYSQLFPILNAALPKDFRGYVKGDLLYTTTPPIVKGAYQFRPNEVEYRIPINSPLGQRIGNSTIGVAMHSKYDDQGSPRQPLTMDFVPVNGLMLEKPVSLDTLEPDKTLVSQIQALVKRHGSQINSLFNPVDLRANKITDFAKLAINYVNTIVGQELPDSSQMILGFLQYLQDTQTPQKYARIIEYLTERPTNQTALAAAFRAFELLHDLKTDIQSQGDFAHPGQEGWVLATPSGYAKAVGRFGKKAFAALNRARNNPPTK